VAYFGVRALRTALPLSTIGLHFLLWAVTLFAAVLTANSTAAPRGSSGWRNSRRVCLTVAAHVGCWKKTVRIDTLRRSHPRLAFFHRLRRENPVGSRRLGGAKSSPSFSTCSRAIRQFRRCARTRVRIWNCPPHPNFPNPWTPGPPESPSASGMQRRVALRTTVPHRPEQLHSPLWKRTPIQQ
jgi:hypothetical protein